MLHSHKHRPKQKPYFTADLGCWEVGRNVRLQNGSLGSALREAQRYLETHKPEFVEMCKEHTDAPYVVQLYKVKDGRKQIVWDYISGDLTEKESS
jgi:hypothetical protein